MTTFKFEYWDVASTKVGEFLPSGARWDMNVKDPSGSFTFNVPQGSLPPGMAVGVSDVLIVQDGAWVWRGQVLGRQASAEVATVTQAFTAVGLAEILNDRYIPAGTAYTAASANIVVDHIIPDIQTQSNGAIVIGQTVGADGAQEKNDGFSSPYFTYPDVVITKTYDQPTAVKAAIDELAAIYPFDWTMHPMPLGKYGLTGLGGTSTPHVVLFPRGADTGTPSIKLSHGVEVTKIAVTDNLAPGGPFCNYVESYPAGGLGAPAVASDTVLMGTHRRRDKVTVAAAGNDFADALTGTAATVLWDGKPRAIPTVTVRPGVPLIELGDVVDLFSETFREVNGKWLVIGRSVTWPTLDDPNVFQQELTLETYNPRTVDPFA